MIDQHLRVRATKIAVFGMAIAFAGFAACVPAHRYRPASNPQRICSDGAKIENGRCICPGGTHQSGDRCVPVQLPPQNAPQ